jgi:crotonobetaine/carnitine-CoA ligase
VGLEGNRRLLHRMLEIAVQQRPDAPFAAFLGSEEVPTVELARGEVWQGAQLFAGALQRSGLRPGDHVALLLGNRPEFLFTLFGCSLAGVVSVPLNTALRGDILKYILAQAEPRVLCVDADLVAETRSAVEPAMSLEQLVVVGSEGNPGEDPRGISYKDFVAEAPPPVPADVEAWDNAAVLYTSGTTGPSKGVMCSHQMIWAWAEQANFVLAYEAGDVSFSCLPLFHGNALFCTLLPALMNMGRVAFAPRFSASAFWQQVHDSGATVTSLLGSMGTILWRQPPSTLERSHLLRLALVIPSPIEFYEQFEERFNTQLTELYGLTDSAIPLGVPHGERRPGSCGVPTPHWECAILDEHDEPVEVGSVGELALRPKQPHVGMNGYLKMPEATVLAWRNLWFHTGDYVRQDKDGWYYFVDRKKDAIRRRGENISSFEVEQVILSHEAVLDCAVLGVPSELMEEEVMAVVVIRPGMGVDPEALAEFCEPRLPYFAVPRFVRIVEELPRTKTEKVQKSLLRSIGITPDTWDGGDRGRRRKPTGGPRSDEHATT